MIDSANSQVEVIIDINIKKDSSHTVTLERTDEFHPKIIN